MDPEVEEALNGLKSIVTDGLKGLQAEQKKHKEAQDEIEKKLNRPRAPQGESADDRGAAERKAAFASFLRRGSDKLTPDEAKALVVSDDTAGGYLAPPEFVAELLKNIVQFSPIRSIARVGTAGAGEVQLPKRTGNMTASWVGETQARPETETAYGMVKYPVREGACYIDVSNQMLEDSAFDMASELSMDFAEEFGRLEGLAFVQGDGVISPEGFLNGNLIPETNSGHASQLTGDALIDLFFAVKPQYRNAGSWLMNGTTLAVVRKLKDGEGQYLLSTAGLADGAPPRLLGRPIAEAVDMPDIGAGAYPIAFGDWRSGYRIYDRVAGWSILRDPYSQATNGKTRFHCRRRVAGGIGKAEALRKLKISA